MRPKIIFDIEERTKAFPKFVFVLFLLCTFVFSSLISHDYQRKADALRALVKFESPELMAKAAIVYDVNEHKILYAKNPDLPLPLASLTKVMTAVTAKKLAGSMDKVSIKLEDLAPEGDSGLKVASDWNTKDLIDYLLIVSSNDGAHALASAAAAWSNKDFIAQMNATSKNIGLANTIFYNEHGLDRGESEGGLPDSSQAGSYGSAQDMAKLFEYALKNQPDILEATRYPELLVRDRNNDIYMATNTNIAANFIPSLIASKTGYTELAGGNLAIAFDAGLERPIIVVVLGSTQEGRFEDTVKLVNETIKYISND